PEFQELLARQSLEVTDMPNDPSRPRRPGWRAAGKPSASAPPKHAWQRGSGQRTGPARAGMARRTKFGLVGLCFLVLVPGIIWLLIYIRPQRPPLVEFGGAPNTTNLATPHAAYSERAEKAFREIDLGDGTRAHSNTLMADESDALEALLEPCKSSYKQKAPE